MTMDNRLTELLINPIVVVIEGCGYAAKALKELVDSFVAAFSMETDPIWEDSIRDPVEELARAIEEMGGTIDTEKLQEFAEIAADMAPIIHKKIPRPPKCTGPVNKANFSANRPPRRARSSCRIVKR